MTNGQTLQTEAVAVQQNGACGVTVGTPSAPAKGFDVQINLDSTTATNPSHLSLTDFSDMKAEGASYVRFIVHWNEFEQSQNVIDCIDASGQQTNNPTATCASGYVSVMDTMVGWATTAHLYSYFTLYWTQHPPGWIGCNSSCISGYCLSCMTGPANPSGNGQLPTAYIAERYGSNQAVMGFGLNETGPGAKTSDQNVLVENEYEAMLTWVRGATANGDGGAPQWMGFVQGGTYGGNTALFNDPNAGWNGTQENWANSALSAYQNSGNTLGTDGDVIVTVHDYQQGTITPPSVAPPPNGLACPNNPCDGRDQYGQQYDVRDGGWDVDLAHATTGSYTEYPISWNSGSQTETDADARRGFKAFLAPFFDLGSGANPSGCTPAPSSAVPFYCQAPVSVEEWSWNTNPATTGGPSGGCAYTAAQMAAFNQSASYGASMESWWDYSTTSDPDAEAQGGDPWASSPGGDPATAVPGGNFWKKEVNAWMLHGCTGQ